MLMRKVDGQMVIVPEAEEADLRAEHARGERLFGMENGCEYVLSAEEEAELRAFWAASASE